MKQMKSRILELNSELSKDISLSFIIIVNILFLDCLFPMTKILPTNSFPFMTLASFNSIQAKFSTHHTTFHTTTLFIK